MKRPFLSYRTSFLLMFVLTVLLFSCKVVVGYLSNSTSLIADSFHMLSDLAVLAVGYTATHFAKRSSGRHVMDNAYTFGRVRAEILGGLINAIFLVAFCFSVTVEALKRFVVAEKVERPIPVAIVGGASLFVNLVGLAIFYQRRKTKSRLNCNIGGAKLIKGPKDPTQVPMKPADDLSDEFPVRSSYNWVEGVSKPGEINREGVFLHIFEHVLSSLMVVISSLVVMFVDKPWASYVDPTITILVVIIVLYSTIPLMEEAIMIFMQSVPADMKTDDLEQRLLKEVPAILGVHEFHLWQLAGEQVIASAHVLLDSTMDFCEVTHLAEEFFKKEGIHHITLQPELRAQSPDTISEGMDECLLLCSEKESCKDYTCCIKEASPVV